MFELLFAINLILIFYGNRSDPDPFSTTGSFRSGSGKIIRILTYPDIP